MYEQLGNEVFKVIEIKTKKQVAYIKKLHCLFRKLIVFGDTVTKIGESLPITILLEDWEGNRLTESFWIVAKMGLAELELELINGKAEFDFLVNKEGSYLINIISNEVPCDVIPLEVTVSV